MRKFTTRVNQQPAEFLYLQLDDMFTMKQEFPGVLHDLFHMAKHSFQKHILIKLDKISELELEVSHSKVGGL